MALFIDLTGQTFGKLTAIKKSEFAGNGKKPVIHWECICECGNLTKVRGNALRQYLTKSCGCGMQSTQFQVKHGMSNTHEYHCWKSMRDRIVNPKPSDKIQYGDRGIDIDPAWIKSFQVFYAAIGSAPSNKHSIDRIDNSKGYWANNVRWATQKEQLRNCRTNHFLTFKGKTQCLTDWSLETGLPISTIYNRIKANWDVAKTLSTPSRKKLI